ncbi:hypothetical protein BJX62DRAFT_237213 [Aspergillus germanicus]
MSTVDDCISETEHIAGQSQAVLRLCGERVRRIAGLPDDVDVMLNYGPGYLNARGSSQFVPIPTAYPPIPPTEATDMASSKPTQ